MVSIETLRATRGFVKNLYFSIMEGIYILSEFLYFFEQINLIVYERGRKNVKRAMPKND